MRARRAAAGFTLIEMLAVLAIIAILTAVLVTQIGGARDAVEVRLARVLLQQIDLAVADYEVDHGDWPASSFAGEGAVPNAINLGGERLVVALWSDGREGAGLSADELGNTDGDQSASALTDIPTRDLFELADPWGNPVAYFHHSDYGRADVYHTFDPVTGERRETQVTALKNPKLGRFYEHRRFQLLCAGADGAFGTDDDIANFKIER
jgi:prepilin-type N-terminal cleavage/methylation domain-containing protein